LETDSLEDVYGDNDKMDLKEAACVTFNVLTAVKISLCVFQPCSMVVGYDPNNPEDGGSTVLRNAGIHPPHYTAQKPRKPRILSIELNGTGVQLWALVFTMKNL
jgi:hypothetical protein